MATWEPDRGEWVAVGLGLAVALGISWLLFGAIGWLGVGLVGLAGLVISARVALFRGHAVPDADFGSTGVGIFARQLEEDARTPPDQRLRRRVEQDKRGAVVYFINTVCIALTATGFILFAAHQL